ncbi:ribulose phosphate epimerase [Janthinobacterium sp. ROICE36]|uniref:GFA family protein n=1 Tax=Janthinobacterium sp. ROICE36 TaxID=2048670 RepID=UPI000C7E96EA|nr:GFA family protein [Janthinobacterium sp. ROICE36]PLY44086.1 ribulose phosphate epimerase [Janthinobacterium sp. ROICE36]
MEKVVQAGGCLCGAVRSEVTGEGSNSHCCSCRNCHQHTGAPTVACVEFARDQVRWTGTAGAPATYHSSAYSSRAFCAARGSCIGAIDDAPTVALLVGSFDDTAQAAFKPEYHSFDDARPGGWSPAPLLMSRVWRVAQRRVSETGLRASCETWCMRRNEKSTPKRARADD